MDGIATRRLVLVSATQTAAALARSHVTSIDAQQKSCHKEAIPNLGSSSDHMFNAERVPLKTSDSRIFTKYQSVVLTAADRSNSQ